MPMREIVSSYVGEGREGALDNNERFVRPPRRRIAIWAATVPPVPPPLLSNGVHRSMPAARETKLFCSMPNRQKAKKSAGQKKCRVIRGGKEAKNKFPSGKTIA